MGTGLRGCSLSKMLFLLEEKAIDELAKDPSFLSSFLHSSAAAEEEDKLP